MLNFRMLWTLMAVFFAAVNADSYCAAHPFHISIAEMEFNRETQRLEVSLKLQASDLENVLAAMAGKRIDVEKDKLNVWVEGYLNRRFYLTTQDLSDQAASSAWLASESLNRSEMLTSKAHFVGSELETTWIWLYFEMELPQAILDSSSKLYFVNAILLERIKDQINTATVRAGAQRHAMKTTLKNPYREFPLQWLTPPQPSSQASGP